MALCLLGIFSVQLGATFASSANGNLATTFKLNRTDYRRAEFTEQKGVLSETHCSAHCLADEKCNSFSYNAQQKMCLKHCMSGGVTGDLVQEHGWRLFVPASDEEWNKLSCAAELNCAAWKAAGNERNGTYLIDVDGRGGMAPFYVECVLDSGNNITTIFHHDTEARTDGGNCEIQLTCVRDVVYDVSLAQIVAVINASQSCRQFIQADCHNSYFRFSNDHNMGFYSRDGTLQKYWGGAPPGSEKCACGVTGTCYVSTNACNCDLNDQVWLSDSGYLTEKSHLPVVKMAFGDMGDWSETVYHILGPLECFN